MDSKITEAIEQYNMLQHADTVIAGVSGGADSMCLLHFLCVLQQAFGLTVIAAHVNHCLRGEEADRDEQFVRRWCKQHKIELAVLRADVQSVAKAQGKSTELCAREIRYDFFDSLAKRYNAKIATAHTASDNIETMLFHLTRGTGMKGLCGIPPVRGNIIRPLLLLTRQQTEAYCQSHKIDYVTDSSNLTDAYTRNKIRRRVIPVLKEINPSLEQAAFTLAKQMKDCDLYLEKQALQALAKAKTDGGYFTGPLSLLEQPVLAKAAVLAAEEENCRCLESVHIEKLVELIRRKSGAIDLPCGLRAVAKQGVFRFVLRENKTENWEIPVMQAKTLTKCNKNFILTISAKAEFDQKLKFNKKLLNNALDYAIINRNSVIRTRREKDRFSPAGRGVSKSVKKLFNESKILQEQRGKIVMIANESNVLWIEGFGVSAQAQVTGQTKRVLLLEVQDA